MPTVSKYIFQANTPQTTRYRLQLISPRRNDAIWEVVKEVCGENTVGGNHCETTEVIFQGWYTDAIKYISENLKDQNVVTTCYYMD